MLRRTIAVVLLILAAAAGGYFWLHDERGPPLSVILVSIDTCRPERLGVYGNTPDVSPRIDTLAKSGVVFDQALANSPYTLPSHMTMLTGLDPVAHGVKRDGDILSQNVTTLAEALRAAGFQCGAFTDGGFVSAGYGFSQGFHVFDDERDLRAEGAVNGFKRILPRATAWLDSHADDDLFLFVHTFDVHAPYQEGDPDIHARFRARPVQDGPLDHELFRLGFMYQMQLMRIPEYGRMGELLNDYDSGVNEADRGVGVLLDWLAAHGRLENALVIVVSDHGESFADHGVHVGHGIGLTDDEIHIPLVIKLPGEEAAGRRIAGPVDLTDVAPTVLDVFGLPKAQHMQGESVLGLVRGGTRRRDFVFGNSPNTECYDLVRDGWKFISPPSILPMTVAERHLGPTNPPAAGIGPDDGKKYQTGPPKKQITLHYDETGDPLGIRDTVLDCARLFDRTEDPHEQTNRAYDESGELVQRARDMATFTKQVFEASQKLHAELDDGATAPTGEIHVAQALEQLGYIGASNTEDKDLAKSELPAGLRHQIEDHYVSPDMEAVIEADKVMQRVRLQVRDGQALPEDVTGVMQNQGDTLVGWAVANPAHWAKIGWRLNELVELAQKAGVVLDADRWADKFRAWAEKQAVRKGAGGGKKGAASAGEKPAQAGDGDAGGTPPR